MKRTVAIYARVSTEHEAQLSALDNQVQYYDDILDKHPNWILYDRYIDEGILWFIPVSVKFINIKKQLIKIEKYIDHINTIDGISSSDLFANSPIYISILYVIQ